ncbi:hypothetical protein IJD44_00920 [bacterium]|nr:hypothetical protein [bacterium]
MIEKKIFVKMMNGIKSGIKSIEIVEETLGLPLSRGKIYDGFVEIYEALIDYFSIYGAHSDIEDDFDFFCWETEFGKRKERASECFSVKGKMFEVNSIEDFYDYLLKAYVNEDKETQELQFNPISRG